MQRATLSPNATITYKPYVHEERQGPVVVFPTFGYQVGVHAACACNELLSLTNAHCTDRTGIGFDEKYWKSMTKQYGIRPPLIESCSYLEVANSFVGKKRKMYLSARKELLEEGLSQRDWRVKMFIKSDKIKLDKLMDRPPRAIQHRSPKYVLSVAKYLRPFEHWLYPSPGEGPSATRFITKGMNPRDVAKLLLTKAEQFTNPLFLCCDHKRFDSTVRVEHLRYEYSVYRRANHSRDLQWLLKKQISNVGRTRSGIRYTIKGTRMSGDYNTGLGNSIINYVVLRSWLRNVKHEIILDGDDSIVIIEAGDRRLLDDTHFNRMGFETTVEETDDIRFADYCQARIVLSDPPVMCRNPCRALSNAAVCLRRLPAAHYEIWASNVLESLYYTNPGMPIYKAMIDRVLPTKKIVMEDYWRKMEGVTKEHVSVQRGPFFETWGISSGIQNAMEESIRHFPMLSRRSPKALLRHGVATGRTIPTITQQRINARFCSLSSSDCQFWDEFGSWYSPAVPEARTYARTTAPPTAGKTWRPKKKRPPDRRDITKNGGLRIGLFDVVRYGVLDQRDGQA